MRTSFFPMGNINMAKDYIIDYSNNNDKWYRKWKSGFIEQGGKLQYITSGGSEINTTLTLLTPFNNTNYSCFFNAYKDDINSYNPSYYMAAYQIINNKSFKIRCQGANNKQYINGLSWYAIGY